MKKLKDKIEKFVLKTEERWKDLPLQRQRLLTKLFFGSYVLLTAVVVANVIISTSRSKNTMSIKHIGGISKKTVEKAPEQKDPVELRNNP